LTPADELKAAYLFLTTYARISREFFADQYARFGMAGIRQLCEIVRRELE
jgi:hypothetical protein